MANENAMPVGFGGLMRYKEEYDSKFKFGPGVVVAMIIVVIALVVGLRIWFT
jgi:preprotein translocase subunit Sec61beta